MSVATENCILELKKYYQKLSWLHSHPFTWPDDSLAPFIQKSSWVRVHWYTNTQLALGYFSFVAYRSGEAYNNPSHTLVLKLYLLFMTVLYALLAVCTSSTLLNNNQFIQFQCSHIKFVRDGINEVLGTVNVDGQAAVRIFKLLMGTIYCSMCFLAVGIFSLNIARPTSPEFLSSLLLDNSSGSTTTFLVTVTSSLLQGYLFRCAANVAIIWAALVYFFALSVPQLLRQQK